MLEPENDLSMASGFERSSKNKDFDTNSALDSGFLSGPQAIYSGEIDSVLDDESSQMSVTQSMDKSQKQQKHHTLIDTNIDSGCIVDSQIDMISKDCLTDHGLPDHFNNLSLKDPSINNLDGSKSNQQQQANLWQLCYKQDNDGDTQLHLAIINEIEQMILAIIRITPAPWLLDMKNDDAQSPIHLAALTQQSNVVRRLLVAGANASIRDGDGNTPLHLACLNGDLATVEALLKPITDAELKEYNQSARYQLPHMNANRQISIDLEQRNFYGENCVHIAAQRNHIDILNSLIRAGVDINAREGRAGYTPLHIAVENNNMELATLLVESCKYINTETLCYRQVTAYQIAGELELTQMMEQLERLGCEVISPPESDEDSDESTDTDSDIN
ncbi:NF-kappa-B inhibitor cactus [Contarinia nasturtii]|uniref:NF-kappa-B inhibitor cactus n=1 Tax=Contarinia nasturtii TaxID=265458 RepID=UPI0012D46C0D|nr:NF-kappa-B inhibitor cactus [Contarinia nasturtii]